MMLVTERQKDINSTFVQWTNVRIGKSITGELLFYSEGDCIIANLGKLKIWELTRRAVSFDAFSDNVDGDL